METKKQNVVISNSFKQTFEFGKRAAAFLKGDDIVVLSGDLGAGKTSFTKGIASGLGIKTQVTSPTFAIFIKHEGQNLGLVHIDAYRLKNGDEAMEIGLDEYFCGQNSVCVIEWGQIIADLLSNYDTINIKIKNLGEDKREIWYDKGQLFGD